MFIQKDDLKTALYNYQIEQITGGDDTIVMQAANAAEEEAKSLIAARYDVEAIFAKEGKQRNALLVSLCASISVFRLVELCNVDIIWEQARQRYDRAIRYLKDLAEGEASISSLPLANTNGENSSDHTIRYGSRQKFNHEY